MLIVYSNVIVTMSWYIVSLYVAQIDVLYVGALQHGEYMTTVCSWKFAMFLSSAVSDADGDVVRCRWAESAQGECGGVCKAFPATLDQVG